MQPQNDKLASGMKKNVLDKKGTPGSDSNYIFNKLPPGEHIENQDLAEDVKRTSKLAVRQPLLSSTEHYKD